MRSSRKRKSTKEETKSGAVNISKIEKSTGEKKEPDVGIRGKKIARAKKQQMKRKMEFPIYKLCILKLFVNEVFQRTGQVRPKLSLGKKTSKKTTDKVKRAVRQLCTSQLDKSSNSKGTKIAAINE